MTMMRGAERGMEDDLKHLSGGLAGAVVAWE